MCIRVSDTATRQFSGSLALVLREIWIKCIHSPIDMGTYTHRDAHVHAQMIWPLHCCCSILLTQSKREESVLISKCSFSFRRAYLSFLSSTILAHPSAASIARQREEISDVLTITLINDVLYTFRPLEKFNNETHPSSMPTLGEIDTKNERARLNEKNLTFV